MVPLALALVLLAAVPLVLSRLAKAVRYRHLPGPWGWPLLGSLPALTRQPLHSRVLEYKRRYGPAFKVSRVQLQVGSTAGSWQQLDW